LILAAKSNAGIYITISLFLNKQPRFLKMKLQLKPSSKKKSGVKKIIIPSLRTTAGIYLQDNPSDEISRVGWTDVEDTRSVKHNIP